MALTPSAPCGFSAAICAKRLVESATRPRAVSISMARLSVSVLESGWLVCSKRPCP